MTERLSTQEIRTDCITTVGIYYREYDYYEKQTFVWD